MKNTGPGAALKLKTKPGNAPLAVNSTKVVTHLNADLVDGLSASGLQTSVIQYLLPANQDVAVMFYKMPNLPKGIYDGTYSVTATMKTPGSTLVCDFYVGGQSVLMGYGGVVGAQSSVNGGGVLDLRSETLGLRCFSSAGKFSVHTTDPVSLVTLVRVDNLTTRTAALDIDG